MICKLLEFGSAQHRASIELRRQVLRIPLGLDFEQEDLDAEHSQYHFACIDGEEIAGILLFKVMREGPLKMRQVAVREDLQGKGIGKMLVQFSEQWATENKFMSIELNARKTAVPFYTALGYDVEGTEFSEVNIPHYKMVKKL
jgi:predicted GNAT family N-acyltransferase